ncbi:MAG: hypothetical protein IJV97_02165 [Alphaproteobacteria bacterium]|nr:hypothetical protein [Alphaproteobacteria bacterium]
MKKILVFLTLVMFANSANALDIVSLANKVQSAADKANAKIEEAQAKKDAQSLEAQEKIENKIADLKAKIANWQASDTANSSETLKAISDAKASIEKLMAQLKALKAIQ